MTGMQNAILCSSELTQYASILLKALSAFGALVIGLIDNLVYPLIVKDRIRLHAVPVFVSTIGALIVFGAAGIVLGPLLLALTDTFVTLWRRRLGIRP